MNIIKLAYDGWVNRAVFGDVKAHYKYTTRTLPIRYIVLHSTGGTDSRNWLAKWNKRVPSSAQNNVSIHYLIQRDGTIYQIIDNKKAAWHVGVCLMPGGETDGNACSIGIELEHLNEPNYTEVQLNNLAQLVHTLLPLYNITGDRVVSHASVARPGPNIRKIDPVNFNWADFWNRVFKLG